MTNDQADSAVLPWVKDIEANTDPEGMFGPYASRPGTLYEAQTQRNPPQTKTRSAHPFTYDHPATQSFAAFAAGESVGQQQQRQRPTQEVGGRTRESEMLSRGAGMRGLGDELDGSESLDIETFGVEPRPDTGYDPINVAPVSYLSIWSQAAPA
jgi:hypothetical protein